MNTLIISIIAGLFFLMAETAIASAQEAKDLCIKQYIGNCLSRCEESANANINCSLSCEEEAKNQCREAGV